MHCNNYSKVISRTDVENVCQLLHLLTHYQRLPWPRSGVELRPREDAYCTLSEKLQSNSNSRHNNERPILWELTKRILKTKVMIQAAGGLWDKAEVWWGWDSTSVLSARSPGKDWHLLNYRWGHWTFHPLSPPKWIKKKKKGTLFD